jgi:hypothetical protein
MVGFAGWFCLIRLVSYPPNPDYLGADQVRVFWLVQACAGALVGGYMYFIIFVRPRIFSKAAQSNRGLSEIDWTPLDANNNPIRESSTCSNPQKS